jgi:hypothetical protein
VVTCNKRKSRCMSRHLLAPAYHQTNMQTMPVLHLLWPSSF